MLEPLKRIVVRVLVRGVRVAVAIKRPVLRVLHVVTVPARLVWRAVVVLLVPPVRVYGGLRRGAKRITDSSKNSLMAFVTHRYVIHAIVIGIVGSVIFTNLGAGDVRAESFGDRSAMYQMVAGERTPIIEEGAITQEQIEQSIAAGTMSATALTAINRGMEAPSAVGTGAGSIALGSTLTATPASTTGDSTAPRTTVETYVVQTGDVLGSIAEKFGVSTETILWANGLRSNSVIKPGDTLTILPVTGVLHTVKGGDSLSKLASTYGVEAETISSFNSIDQVGLNIGEKIVIPGGKQIVAAPIAVRPPASSLPPVTSGPLPSAPSSSVGGMIWPTDLRIITQRYNGWGHTGIDIDCKDANYNYAAADGVVSYAGWRNGYGNTVEINHGGGITTRYGHHKSIAVSTGQSVTQGTALGVCGTTGRSTGTHLHFEVMVNGAFQNPLNYIR